ncbi:MAG: FecR domain-containing protein [Gammaproteobacteria bacterium]|nr:FecR domain-containing protein [Gammaproteobacteria bacterium]
MPHRAQRWVIHLVTLLLMLGVVAVPATEVATIKVLRGTVSVERNGQILPGKLGLALEVADQVVTGVDSAIGITFQDNSLLSLGPNSRLTVDRFQFNSTTHEGAFETSLKQGKLAVISGKIAKHREDAMKVRTPASIIGVRGTEFVVEAAARR